MRGIIIPYCGKKILMMIVEVARILMMIIAIIGIFTHPKIVHIVMEQDMIQMVDNVKNVMALVKYNKIFLNQYASTNEKSCCTRVQQLFFMKNIRQLF